MSSLRSGELFANRFEIDRAAGSGGMGTVYRARDHLSGQLVALKLVSDSRNESSDSERFARESQILAELSHPGIVSYVAHGMTQDGQRFLVMRWLEGEDLAERLTRGPLTLREALALTHRIAQALAFAHDRKVIHRDLKPTNIFLPGGDIDAAQLLDFGIARRLGGSRAMTRTGTIVGTPEYMAPEQARGARELTPAVDLFSLGCVLYECLKRHLTETLLESLINGPFTVERS
jgi:serine/threonine protein kinase